MIGNRPSTLFQMNEITYERNDKNPGLRAEVEVQPCIGLVEVASVPRGVELADGILWEADVELLFATPVQPGKYLVLLTGSVEDVASSLRRAAELAGGDLLDQLHLPQVHPQVLAALTRNGGVISGQLDAVGLVETRTVASAIRSADVAVKTSTVDLIDMRIANGLGGKSFFTLTGEVSDVRSAITAGAAQAESEGRLERSVVIPRPHPELSRHL